MVRVRPAVPKVIKNYPEKRFWRLVDAPFLSKSYYHVYFWGSIFLVGSYGLGCWVILKYNLFNKNMYRGNIRTEVDVINEYPDLEHNLIFSDGPSFTEKFKAREQQRLEQIRQAKLKQKEQLKKDRPASDEQKVAAQPAKTAQSPDAQQSNSTDGVPKQK